MRDEKIYLAGEVGNAGDVVLVGFGPVGRGDDLLVVDVEGVADDVRRLERSIEARVRIKSTFSSRAV